MKLTDFDFDLPEKLIATRPAVPRSSARLLVAREDELSDRHMTDLPEELCPGDRLILNDTKVIPARLSGRRIREGGEGAKVEVTLLSPTPDGNWTALLKPLRKVRDGEVLILGAGLEATVQSRAGGQATLAFNLQGDDFEAALTDAGAMPLPPYIAQRRAADDRDRTDYQTVWARHSGAVAAPTASLHFDDALLTALQARGVDITHVTLHVGAGTFLPVKVDDVTTHKMHSERGTITDAAAVEINRTRKSGGRIIPVGTTALRLLETATNPNGELSAWSGSTDIFIYPGYDFRITDALITNFHLPKSTLLMLVSALMGQDRMRDVYSHAIRENYRFFSYGDASLLMPNA